MAAPREDPVPWAQWSPPAERLTIDSLIQKVEAMQRRGHAETIERLTMENDLLRHLIDLCRRRWHEMIKLLETALEALVSLRRALEHTMREEIEAEKDWLAFCGVASEGSERARWGPGGRV